MEALIDVRLCQALDLQAKGSECSLTTRRRVAERASPFKRRALERVVRLPHPACSTLRLSQIGNCSQFIFWPPPKLFTVVCGELNPALLATCEKLWTSYKRLCRVTRAPGRGTGHGSGGTPGGSWERRGGGRPPAHGVGERRTVPGERSCVPAERGMVPGERPAVPGHAAAGRRPGGSVGRCGRRANRPGRPADQRIGWAQISFAPPAEIPSIRPPVDTPGTTNL